MELTARRLTDIYICLMLAAFPLWTGFEGYTGITRAKFLFFAALTGVPTALAGPTAPVKDSPHRQVPRD